MKKKINSVEDMDVFKKAHKITVNIYVEELSRMLGGLVKSLTDTNMGH